MELSHVKQKLKKTEAKIETDAGNMKVGRTEINMKLTMKCGKRH